MKRVMPRMWSLALAACVLLVGGARAKPKAQTVDVATEAYIYGYSLVLMDLTRDQGLGLGYKLNCFNHDRRLKGPENLAVVRTNNDNLYSAAFLDLSTEPLVLHVPETTGRYFMLQILDGWTNTFACPGSRTTGAAAQDFILAGPDWRGPLRGNTPVFRSPTNHVWIIGRTEVRHYADPAEMEAELDEVHAIQDQYTLTPLSEWRKGNTSVCFTENVAMSGGETALQKLQKLTAVEFLQKLSGLMATTPAAGWDRPALKRFEAIGFSPGKAFNPPAAMQADINAAKAVAEARITAGWRAIPETINGWGVVLTEIGTFGNDYLRRAAVSRFGLGANLLVDAIYPSAYTDMNGAWLNANGQDYRIHFEPGQLPPVNGFWSITLYRGDYLYANDIDRYAIHSTDPLYENSDGSVDIFIQTDPPDDPALQANWLPAPPGPFNLTLRMYWPDKTALKGQWLPAPIEPLP